MSGLQPDNNLSADLRGGIRYRAIRNFMRALLRAGWGLRAEGLERLPARPPYLMTPNHSSEIDPVVLSSALPFRPSYVAGRELDRYPWLFRALRWFDPIFVRRGLADVGAIKACLARLARGEVLIIFPEGGVVQGPDLGTLHPGAAFVALRAGVPVVPVALTGVARMWPLGARWPRPSRVAVHIGDPLVPDRSDDPLSLTARIGQAIRRLRDASPFP